MAARGCGRDGPGAGVSNGNAKATVADIGITRKEIHDARLVRDAEVADPGIVRRTVEEDVAAGKGPTKAKVSRVVKAVAERGKSEPNNKIGRRKAAALAPKETQHERDLRVPAGIYREHAAISNHHRREYAA